MRDPQFQKCPWNFLKIVFELGFGFIQVDESESEVENW